MMFKVSSSNNIIMTRGDSGILNLDLKMKSGERYEMADGDTCVLTVKKNVDDPNVIFQKNIVNGQFIISPNDTKDLKYNTYKYDVQLTTAGGSVYTVVTPSDFKVEAEVTW